MNCEECQEKLLTNHADKDHGFVFCRSCGLVFDSNPMGHGISGLSMWLRSYGVKKSDQRKITALYVMDGLKAARLASIPMVESYLVRQI